MEAFILKDHKGFYNEQQALKCSYLSGYNLLEQYCARNTLQYLLGDEQWKCQVNFGQDQFTYTTN